MILWVCGRVHDETWGILGIFSEERMAIERCTTISDFVGAIDLNAILPEETVEWPGCYYPLKNT